MTINHIHLGNIISKEELNIKFNELVSGINQNTRRVQSIGSELANEEITNARFPFASLGEKLDVLDRFLGKEKYAETSRIDFYRGVNNQESGGYTHLVLTNLIVKTGPTIRKIADEGSNEVKIELLDSELQIVFIDKDGRVINQPITIGETFGSEEENVNNILSSIFKSVREEFVRLQSYYANNLILVRTSTLLRKLEYSQFFTELNSYRIVLNFLNSSLSHRNIFENTSPLLYNIFDIYERLSEIKGNNQEVNSNILDRMKLIYEEVRGYYPGVVRHRTINEDQVDFPIIFINKKSSINIQYYFISEPNGYNEPLHLINSTTQNIPRMFFLKTPFIKKVIYGGNWKFKRKMLYNGNNYTLENFPVFFYGNREIEKNKFNFVTLINVSNTFINNTIEEVTGVPYDRLYTREILNRNTKTEILKNISNYTTEYRFYSISTLRQRSFRHYNRRTDNGYSYHPRDEINPENREIILGSLDKKIIKIQIIKGNIRENINIEIIRTSENQYELIYNGNPTIGEFRITRVDSNSSDYNSSWASVPGEINLINSFTNVKALKIAWENSNYLLIFAIGIFDNQIKIYNLSRKLQSDSFVLGSYTPSGTINSVISKYSSSNRPSDSYLSSGDYWIRRSTTSLGRILTIDEKTTINVEVNNL